MSDLTATLPQQPRDDDGVVFRALWEAQAFSMAVALHQHGVFTWRRWSQALADQIAAAPAAGDAGIGHTYYLHWLTALEKLVIAEGASSVDELTRYQRAWARAADRTPHGQPLDLRPEDLAPL